MRLCSETAGTRERLQDGSLTLSAAAQLQNTFDLLQRTATATVDPAAAPAAPELLPGGTGTSPEAGALGAAAAAPARPGPALDAAQRQELVAQASGKSTREVKQLLAAVAPELAPPADRMRALDEDRWELKVVIDAACQRGIEQLRALLSDVDPHLTAGQLVERLVQDGLQRYDPGRPRRGRGGGRREARAGQASEPMAQQGPAGGATSPAKRGAQEHPAVPPTPQGTSARGSTPAPEGTSARGSTPASERTSARDSTSAREALTAEGPARGIGDAGTSAAAAPPAPPAGREPCRGSTPVRAKPAAAAPAPPHWRRSRRPVVGRTPPYRRHGRNCRQTRARPPRWQRWIVVAGLLRQRCGQGWRSSMAVRGRSQRQPARPGAARSRPAGRADHAIFRRR